MKKEELSSAKYIKLLSYVMSEISLSRIKLDDLTKIADKVILGGKTLEQARSEVKEEGTDL